MGLLLCLLLVKTTGLFCHRHMGVCHSCRQATSIIHFLQDFSDTLLGFPGGSDGNKSACNEGDPSLFPGSGRSPGGGDGNPLQYSCLENPMDRGAWRAAVHGVTENPTDGGAWRAAVHGVTRVTERHAGCWLSSPALCSRASLLPFQM